MLRRHFLTTSLAGIAALAMPRSIKALAPSPDSQELKWAVIYSSSCGSTKDAANWINEGMGNIASVVDVTTSPAIADYDYIVIGGWIDAAALDKNAKDFISKNKAALKDKIRGLFTLCGNGGKAVGQSQIKSYLTDQIVSLTGVSDKPAKLFNGRSVPSCNGMGMTYDLLKKDDCTAFGKQIIDAATAAIIDRQTQHNRFGLSDRADLSGSSLTISYIMPRECNVLLTVTALNGQKVATLVSSRQKQGFNCVKWNTANTAPGIYMYHLEADGIIETKITKIIK